MNNQKDHEGFTIIELMVTITLAAVVLVLAVPSFTNIIRDNRLVTQTNSLISALNIARSEAAKRGVRITICRSTDQSSCTTSNPSKWEDGWIMFFDTRNFGTRDTSAPIEEIIQVSEGLSGSNSLRSGGNYSNYISYLPNGMSRGNTGLANDTFNLCDVRGASYGRKIIVSSTGRPKAEKGANTCP